MTVIDVLLVDAALATLKELRPPKVAVAAARGSPSLARRTPVTVMVYGIAPWGDVAIATALPEIAGVPPSVSPGTAKFASVVAVAGSGGASNVTTNETLPVDAALATLKVVRPVNVAVAIVSAAASLARVTPETVTV